MKIQPDFSRFKDLNAYQQALLAQVSFEQAQLLRVFIGTWPRAASVTRLSQETRISYLHVENELASLERSTLIEYVRGDAAVATAKVFPEELFPEGLDKLI